MCSVYHGLNIAACRNIILVKCKYFSNCIYFDHAASRMFFFLCLFVDFHKIPQAEALALEQRAFGDVIELPHLVGDLGTVHTVKQRLESAITEASTQPTEICIESFVFHSHATKTAFGSNYQRNGLNRIWKLVYQPELFTLC
jgi:hypothetical protein